MYAYSVDSEIRFIGYDGLIITNKAERGFYVPLFMLLFIGNNPVLLNLVISVCKKR